MTTVEATECTPKEEAIVNPEGILKKMEAIAIGEGSPKKEAIVVSEGSPKKAEAIVLPGGALKKEVVAAGKTDETQKMRRIQVSNTKKPLFFYINLAKRYIKQSNHVELSALGTAIPTAVIIAEILKGSGLATQKDISISTVGTMDEIKGRLILKAKIEIMLGKTEDFNNLTRNASKPSKKAANKK